MLDHKKDLPQSVAICLEVHNHLKCVFMMKHSQYSSLETPEINNLLGSPQPFDHIMYLRFSFMPDYCSHCKAKQWYKSNWSIYYVE